MKATYIRPATLITVVRTHNMISTSTRGTSIFNEDASADNDVLVRRGTNFNVWGDESNFESWEQ